MICIRKYGHNLMHTTSSIENNFRLSADSANTNRKMYMKTKSSNDASRSAWKKWSIILSFVVLFIGLIGVLALSLLYGLIGGKYVDEYGVVMDAGSSKTNTIVFKWRSNKNKGTGCVSQEDNCYSTGGIAKMSPLRLEPIIDCIKNIKSVISQEQRSKTPLFFAATAGMRLLNLTNSARASQILQQLKMQLPKINLTVKAIEIISGRDEGIYGWTAANFLLNTLDLPQKLDPWVPTTYGSLDMGGASMQVSIAMPHKMSERNSSEYITKLKLYGQTFHVFTQSHLCFGRDEAQNRYEALLLMDQKNKSMEIQDPCAPQGYSKTLTTENIFKSICARPKDPSKYPNRTYTYIGTGDPKDCLFKVETLLGKDVCQKFEVDECFKRHPIQPKHQKYVASATFFYTAKFLNVTNSTLEKYEEAMEQFCLFNLTEVQSLANNSFELLYCFSANYIYTILLKGLGFTNETWVNIEFVNQVAEKDVGWPLGYMINATNIISEKLSPRLLTITTFVLSVTICILFISAVSIFLLVTFKKSWTSNMASA